MSARILPRRRMTLSLVGALAACGSIETPYEDTTETAKRTAAAPESLLPSSAQPSASAAPDRPDNGNRAERLAKNLLDGWVGWHRGRKAFIVITTFTQEGTGMGVISAVATEKGYEDEATLCKPGEGCEATRDDLIDKATAWIDEKQLTEALAIEAIEVKPGAGFPTADVGALGGKLVWKRDHYDVVRGTTTTSLPKLEFSKEFKVTPSQVAASPDGSFVVALFDMAPGPGYAKGFNAHVDVKVQRVP